MADLKPISAFNAASAVDANTLFLVSTPNGADYDSENASAALVADAVVNDFEYTQDLSTVSKKVTGAINENKSVIGYSYDEYDATTAYSTGDLCIYNNTLYKALQATTGNLPTNTTYWEPTSIADEIDDLNTNKADTSDIPTKTSDLLNDSGFPVVNNVSWGQSLTINYIKSNFLLFVSNRLFALWFYGSGYSNVDIRNLGTNDVSSGTGSVTMDIITVTRTGTGFTVTTTSSVTLTVIG